MTEQELDEQLLALRHKIQDINQQIISLKQEYASQEQQKLAEIGIVKGSPLTISGDTFFFDSLVYDWALQIRATPARKDGTPSARVRTIYGIRIKDLKEQKQHE